jgi:hypothetical protein
VSATVVMMMTPLAVMVAAPAMLTLEDLRIEIVQNILNLILDILNIFIGQIQISFHLIGNCLWSVHSQFVFKEYFYRIVLVTQNVNLEVNRLGHLHSFLPVTTFTLTRLVR